MDRPSSIERSSESNSVTIRDLFPSLSEEQLKEVKETLHSYFETVWEIYEELKRERPEIIDKLKRPS